MSVFAGENSLFAPSYLNLMFSYMKRIIIPYQPHLKEIARTLRNNLTYAEVLLWNQLKQKKMNRMDFDRKRPILEYIIDFYCEFDDREFEEKFRKKSNSSRAFQFQIGGLCVLLYHDSNLY